MAKRVSKNPEGFVTVKGQAAKINWYRHNANGLMPSFEGLRFSAGDADTLDWLVQEGCLVHVTISQADKGLFDEQEGEPQAG